MQPSCQGAIRPFANRPGRAMPARAIEKAPEWGGGGGSLFVEINVKAIQGLMKQLADSLAGEAHFLADLL